MTSWTAAPISAPRDLMAVRPTPMTTMGASRRTPPITMTASDDFDQFFLENHAALVRTLTVITGDAELAADAVQEAFQRAFVRWGRIGRYDQPESWVRRVAINRSRDVIRSEQRRRRNEERAAPSEATNDREPDHLLVALLAELPERQRTAMALYYLEGLSVQQAAEEMSITTGAVKYHLHEGRKALKPALEREGAP